MCKVPLRSAEICRPAVIVKAFGDISLHWNMEIIVFWRHIENDVLNDPKFSISATNPLDYVYQAMGCTIQLLEEDSVESQYILKYIYSSCKSFSIFHFKLHFELLVWWICDAYLAGSSEWFLLS